MKIQKYNSGFNLYKNNILNLGGGSNWKIGRKKENL